MYPAERSAFRFFSTLSPELHDEGPDYRAVTRIVPVRLRFCRLFGIEIVDITYNISGAEYVGVPEMIAVVPFFCQGQSVFDSYCPVYILDFIFEEAEILVV